MNSASLRSSSKPAPPRIARGMLERVKRVLAQLRLRHAGRERVLDLRRTIRMLAAINGLADRRGGPRSAANIARLGRIDAWVAKEIAKPSLSATADREAGDQYIADLDRLIRAYAVTESMLDEESVVKLDWFSQQIRLEYLRARLVAHRADAADGPARRRGAPAVRVRLPSTRTRSPTARLAASPNLLPEP